MKPFILLFIIFNICWFSVNGQKNSNKFDFYLSTGIAHSDVYLPIFDGYNYRNILTVKLGPSVSYRLNDKISLHGDIMFLYSKLDLHSPYLNVFGTVLLPALADYKQTIYLINLPLKSRYLLSERWFVALGPSIDIQIDSQSSKYAKWFSVMSIVI